MSTTSLNPSFTKWFRSVCLLLIAAMICLSSANGLAQSFNSGSTGADGALDFSSLPSGTVVTFDPKKFNPPLNPAGDNIFNFTTINIPTGIIVRLSGRVLSGPVWWLATGDVTVNGIIDLKGEDGPPVTPVLDQRLRAMPGAGGFSGGVGGKWQFPLTPSQPLAQPGDGPAGGAAANPNSFCGQFNGIGGSPGSFTGNQFLVPLVGGSGGGGGGFNSSALSMAPYGGGGGAGGGVLLIASSTTITVNGNIVANGGAGSNNGGFACQGGTPPAGAGAPGAGGAIRLVAPLINGVGSLSARGGGVCPVCNLGSAGDGAIRLEAFNENFNGNFNGTPFSLASPFSVFLPSVSPPSIAIISINGVNVTQPPTGNLTTPDVSINTTSPVQMTIQAKFIPPGTVITLHVFSDNDTDQTVQTTPLQGTLQSSTATATVTFPSGFSLQFVKATWSQ